MTLKTNALELESMLSQFLQNKRKQEKPEIGNQQTQTEELMLSESYFQKFKMALSEIQFE